MTVFLLSIRIVIKLFFSLRAGYFFCPGKHQQRGFAKYAEGSEYFPDLFIFYPRIMPT